MKKADTGNLKLLDPDRISGKKYELVSRRDYKRCQKACRGVNNAEWHFSKLILSW